MGKKSLRFLLTQVLVELKSANDIQEYDRDYHGLCGAVYDLHHKGYITEDDYIRLNRWITNQITFRRTVRYFADKPTAFYWKHSNFRPRIRRVKWAMTVRFWQGD